ncbi:hypothetical protein LIER_01483 [Lithospermum erythrorhizon]|uniref:Uncharacterized protein n=1 Tax=Lithospermum erythrorhizon TaxID=34254 RepID=A0AAV3NQM5_LITER
MKIYRLKRKGRRKGGCSRRPRKRQNTKQQQPSSMASSEQKTMTLSEAPPSPSHELDVSNGGGDNRTGTLVKGTVDELDSLASQTPLDDTNGGSGEEDEAVMGKETTDDELDKENVGENAEKIQENETGEGNVTSNERVWVDANEVVENAANGFNGVKKCTQEFGNGWIAPEDDDEEDTEDSETIVEILKAIGYSSPFTVGGDVSITFVARRSDGMEVTVDNETLKKTQPQLVIFPLPITRILFLIYVVFP